MTTPHHRPVGGRLRATQLPMVCGLAVLWVLLWGTVSVANIVTGLVVGVLVCVVFPLPPIESQVKLRPVGILRFAGRFVVDMLVSSWRLNRWILSPEPPPCAVLGVRMRCPGDLMLTATAVAVSAVPGSTVLEVHRANGVLYLHVIGARNEADQDRARREVLRLEARVVRAFGTRADNAAVDEALGRTRAPAGDGDGPTPPGSGDGRGQKP